MTGAIVSFSSMAVAGRELSARFDTFEIMMYRSAFGLLIVLGFAFALGTWRELPTKRFKLHLIRNMAHFTGQNLWFFAVTMIPLAQVFALEFTTPLWVVLLAPFLLGEKITKFRAIAAALGFIGILIVARPRLDAIDAGVIAAASCAVFFALTMMFTKKLTRDQSLTQIMFYLTALQLLFGVISAGFDGDIAAPNSATLPYLLVVSAGGLLAHFCITNALKIAPASVVVPFDFLRLPVIAIVGMALYNESLDIYVGLGALLIFGGNYLNVWAETRRKFAT